MVSPQEAGPVQGRWPRRELNLDGRGEAAPSLEQALGGGLAVGGGPRREEGPTLEESRRGRPVSRKRSPSAGWARAV